jgi:peptide deformylase
VDESRALVDRDWGSDVRVLLHHKGVAVAPEQETAMIRDVAQHPAKCLLSPTVEVTRFDDRLVQLVADMFDTMRANNGIGLAANQIHDDRRVAVMHVPGWPEMVMVNPMIVKSKGEGTHREGCLSVDHSKHWVDVKRSKIVWVQYRDLQGGEHTLKASDLLARCVQHECDHLDGLTCLERSSVSEVND